MHIIGVGRAPMSRRRQPRAGAGRSLCRCGEARCSSMARHVRGDISSIEAVLEVPGVLTPGVLPLRGDLSSF